MIKGFLTATCWIISLMPVWMVDGVARTLAFLAFDVLRLRRRLVLKNLEIAFGAEKSEAERIRIGRLSYYNFILTLMEFFSSRFKDPLPGVTLENRSHIDQALAKGRGAVVICCHTGNWETMGAACTRLIMPAHVFVKRVGDGAVAEFVEELRARIGFLCVKRKKKGDGFKAASEAFDRGEIIGFVMDQARNDLKLPFFGRPAKTNGSLAALVLKKDPPLVPAFIIREAPFKHRLIFLDEVILERDSTLSKEAQIEAWTREFNGVVEVMVRYAPEQYFWLHNRWK